MKYGTGYIIDPPNKIFKPFDKSQIIGLSTSNNKDVDLREFSISRHDQKQTSSCVSNSTLKALEIKYAEKFGVENTIPLSRLDLYFGARNEMNPQQNHIDAGTNICLAMDVLRRFGVCKESTWPFDPEKINIPSPIIATREAFSNKINGHFKITSTGNNRIDDIILNLQNKNPVVFGTQVGSNWQNYNSSSDPITECKDPEGGHALVIVGFINGLFVIENSWAETWGYDGFAFVDPAVIGNEKVTTDLWVMACDFDSFW